MRIVNRPWLFTLGVFLVIAVAMLLHGPDVAFAHPLGNFTINRYARIEPGADGVYVKYVLDIAEIPAFQEMAQIDLDRDGTHSDEERSTYLENKADELKGGLYLALDDSPVALSVQERDLLFSPGQGGIPTLRISLLFRGDVAVHKMGQSVELYYRDDNYEERLGWKEVVVRAGRGVSLLQSSVPQTDKSNELRAYPKNELSNPLDQREARSTFVFVGAGPRDVPASTAAVFRPADQPTDVLGSLLASKQMSLPVVLAALAIALGLGALHAASPGHGKTIMAAYLIGTKGTARHAIFLGLTVTFSHTIGVVGLGMVVLYASHLVTPERLYPWLGLGSGAVIIAIGAWLLVGRLRAGRDAPHSHDNHAETHDHPHAGRDDVGRLRITWKSLTALGIVGGLVPSASALIILLAAVSLNRVGLGLLLIVAFSAGMASVLGGVGLLLVYASRAVERVRFRRTPLSAVASRVPLITAFVVLVSGLVVALRAASQVGLL